MVTRVRKPITPKAKAAAARAKAKATTGPRAPKATTKPTTKTKKATPTRRTATKATTTSTRKGKKNVDAIRANREAGYDEHGFVNGSDASAIAAALVEGGESRVDIANRLAEELDPTTRNGTEKKVSSMVSGMVSKLQERGYTIESSFRMVAP